MLYAFPYVDLHMCRPPHGSGRAGEWRLPQVEIRDEPLHQWRGLMLDVSRHFFNASEVKHLLRTMDAWNETKKMI